MCVSLKKSKHTHYTDVHKTEFRCCESLQTFCYLIMEQRCQDTEHKIWALNQKTGNICISMCLTSK